jgi:hypothetical protein
MLHRAVWQKFIDVSVMLTASIIRAMSALIMEALSTSETSENLYHEERLIALMMEAARTTSETLVNFYQTTRRYNPEDSHLRTHRRENLKSY